MKNEPTKTIFDYLDWRGDLTFTENAFNEVDGLILTVLAYLDYSYVDQNEVTFYSDAVNELVRLSETEGYDVPFMLSDSLIDFAIKAASTTRFKDLGICNFVNHVDLEQELQFSAVTFLLPDNTAFLAFRGTDNTLVGWKEDFNMSFISSVPAQIEAAQYAENVLEHLSIPVRAGGHSKGGNLAIWACAHLSEEKKNQVLTIYNMDGPGFREEFFCSAEYASVKDRIQSFVPASSIVGVLLEHDDYVTIQSSNTAAMQHDPFSWDILGTHFVYDPDRTASGKAFDVLLNNWIRSMSMEEREYFVNYLYEMITAAKAKTLSEIDQKKWRSLFLMSKSFHSMPKDKQYQLVHGLLKIFFKEETIHRNRLFARLFPEETAQELLETTETI